MWEAGIAPEFYDSSLTKKQDVWEGLISTQKLLNAHEYRKIVEKNQRLFVSKVHQKIRRMHTLDICHTDLEVSNIVMANNVIDPRGNENFDIFFIDWDFSFNVSTISSKIINFFEFDPNSDMASQCFDHDMNQFNDSFERYIK
jgi:tRNA A-37 threonylcarbamoyl transferase component Bud32